MGCNCQHWNRLIFWQCYENNYEIYLIFLSEASRNIEHIFFQQLIKISSVKNFDIESKLVCCMYKRRLTVSKAEEKANIMKFNTYHTYMKRPINFFHVETIMCFYYVWDFMLNILLCYLPISVWQRKKRQDKKEAKVTKEYFKHAAVLMKEDNKKDIYQNMWRRYIS
jgi:hypothetical protein